MTVKDLLHINNITETYLGVSFMFQTFSFDHYVCFNYKNVSSGHINFWADVEGYDSWKNINFEDIK